METKPTNVESFQFDHRLAKAPSVWVVHRETLPSGDTLVKYDVWSCRPNQEHLEMPVVYSLEHSIAEHMCNHTKQLTDFSSMGCQTGFYALTLGTKPEEFMWILEKALVGVVRMTEVPAASETQCG